MSVAEELENLTRLFPVHPIDSRVAFEEWGGTHVDARVFRDGVDGKRWTDLGSAFLEHHHDALVFFGPTSMPEFLPAYLSAFARRDPALSAMPSFLLGILTRERNDARFDELYSHLTAEQRRAVARVLAAYEAEVAGSSRQPDVTAALDSYWREQIGRT